MSVDTKITETLGRMHIRFHFLDRASALGHILLRIGTYSGRYTDSFDGRSEFAHRGRDLNCCAARAWVSFSILRARTPGQGGARERPDGEPIEPCWELPGHPWTLTL